MAANSIAALGLGEEQSDPKKTRNSRAKRWPSQSASVFSRPCPSPSHGIASIRVKRKQDDAHCSDRLPNICTGTGFSVSDVKSGHKLLTSETAQDAGFLTSKRDSGDSRGSEIGLLRPFSLLDADFAISRRRTKLQRGNRFLSWSRSMDRILQHLG